jgi:hypothetical protein
LTEYHFGPEIAFGHEMAKAWPNETIGIIKFSTGGTSLLAWKPDWSKEDGDIEKHPANVHYNTAGQLRVGKLCAEAFSLVHCLGADAIVVEVHAAEGAVAVRHHRFLVTTSAVPRLGRGLPVW